MLRHFRNTDSGAAAIEYALLAGLLALGITGSLIATKSSLNRTYSAVSQGIDGGGSGSGGAAAPMTMPTSSIAKSTFWSSRTLASGYPTTTNTASGPKTTYLFTDGFSADFTPRTDGSFSLNYFDPTSFTKYVSYIMSNGSTYYASYTYTDATMSALLSSRTQSNSTRGAAGNPDNISTMQVSTYNASGATTSSSVQSPTAFDSNQAVNMFLYDKYFQSIN